MNFFEELEKRGLVHQYAGDSYDLMKHFNESRNIYCGFDPTADSLTVGNLLPLIVLKIAERHGHKPHIMIGNQTALIGDPSGKTSERPQMDFEDSRSNGWAIEDFIVTLFEDCEIHRNYTVYMDMKFTTFLQEYAQHFSVNEMISKSFVADRLKNKDQGISLKEFMYSTMQAYDFHWLHDMYDVTVQIGGTDQWGNIVSGLDLIGKLNEEKPDVFGFTFPLVEKADGGKFGKSESNPVWLNANKTSPFDFFQFWMNISDQDAIKWAPMFLHSLSLDAIHTLSELASNTPQFRLLQNELAFRMTTLVHGCELAESCSLASDMMFDDGFTDFDAVEVDELEGLLHVLPNIKLNADIYDHCGSDILDILKDHGFIKSLRTGRELIEDGVIEINMKKVVKNDKILPVNRLHDRFSVIKFGKKKWMVIEWE